MYQEVLYQILYNHYLYWILSRVLGTLGERSEQAGRFCKLVINDFPKNIFQEVLYKNRIPTKFVLDPCKVLGTTSLCKHAVLLVFRGRRGHRGTLVPYPYPIFLIHILCIGCVTKKSNTNNCIGFFWVVDK
jgi:hypothetical protein